jgi:hypothetical protein
LNVSNNPSRLKFQGQLVKIFVGPKEQKWVVHQDVICEKSLWFQRVFTCDLFETSRTKSIFLGKHGFDVDSKTFECFVDWIYGRHICCDESHENPADVTLDHVKKWLALYFFADDIDLDELSQEALVLYKACSEWTLPCPEEIGLIYENTLEDSPLREHVLHALVEESFDRGPKEFELFRDAIACNDEFAREFSKALKEHNGLANAKDCLFDCCTIHTKVKARRKARGYRRRMR